MMRMKQMTKHAVLALSWSMWSGYMLLTGGTSSEPDSVGRVTSIYHKLAASSNSTTSCSRAMYPLLRNISEPTWA